MTNFKNILITLILFIQPITDLLASQPMVDDLIQRKSCDTSSIQFVSDLLDKSLERIKSENRVFAWELEDRSHRIPHYCIQQCACIFDEYVKDLKNKMNLGEYALFGVRLSGGKSILPIEIKTQKINRVASYRYHTTLMIYDKINDCSVIFDPIVSFHAEQPANKPMDAKTWSGYIPSIQDNKIFIFEG